MKTFRNTTMIVLFLGLASYVLIAFYPYIFSRKVKGAITGVERVTEQMAIVTGGGAAPSSQIFSFAVAIRDDKTGEIVTGSTEDRQWAVATPGLCAEAEFFPYPPWELKKWGTYYNARLLKLYDCPAGTLPIPVPPAVPTPPVPTPAPPAGPSDSGAPSK
jgi:hypothetical protein